MTQKRFTIYDIAKELGIATSAVSKALNNQKGASKKVREMVLKKAEELHFRYNSHAANLRSGFSKTVGVVVPHLNQSFFSNAIAGIEEACSENSHGLVICQSHNSLEKERLAIKTLIHHNVDCILISVSAETVSDEHLMEVMHHNIHLVQFDRYLPETKCDRVINDNKEAAYAAVKTLADQGYRRIGFMGGPSSLTNFNARKSGYFEAIRDLELELVPEFIADNILSAESARIAASTFLKSTSPPDAVFTVSDHQALALLQVASSLHIEVPEKLGVFGFANEEFGEITRPTISSVDQKSRELGYEAARLYFDRLSSLPGEPVEKVIRCELISRMSSSKQRSQ